MEGRDSIMILHLNLNSNSPYIHIDRFVVVFIVRANKKHKIIYNSGLQYFYTPEDRDYIVDRVKQKFQNINLEVHNVDTYKAHAPQSDEISRGVYWCPYCQGYHKFINGQGGYKQCPICGISDSDFYVKKYNNLWSKGVRRHRKNIKGGRKK